METKILIVDHTDFCDVLKAHLEAVGLTINTASDGVSGMTAFRKATPDVLLVAAELPYQGTQQLLALCAEHSTPVIVMAASGDVGAKIALLDAGADDVLVKPFDLYELVARIKALLRRVRALTDPRHSDVIRFENFEISQEKFELKLGGKKVDIPPKELQLLYCLASSPNRVFSREQLLEHVWDFAFLGDSRTVDVHIKRLREKLKGVSEKWALKTVWGVGYKFELYN
ncbi:MAG: response regulator transcription factor [Clostridia bacterium]|nr:response regulator transcription factor [Clostridia bacterium]